MLKRPVHLLLAFLLLALVSACGDAAASGPPEINFGRDICIECGMIIDDPRFAAAYRTSDGTEQKFDDLGGLILTGRESGILDEAQVWVSDFDDEVLIDAETAWFVPTLGVASPMGHGILAFGERGRAEAMAESLDGEVIQWEMVKTLPAIEGLVGHHHMDHEDHMDHDHGMDSDGDHDDHMDSHDEHDG